MFGGHQNADPAPGIKVHLHPTPPGGKGGYEIVEQAVGEMFVKGAFVAEGPQVELERLGLHDFLVGHITDVDLSKIGLPRLGAETGKFGCAQFHHIVAFRVAVGKGFQFAVWLGASFSELAEV